MKSPRQLNATRFVPTVDKQISRSPPLLRLCSSNNARLQLIYSFHPIALSTNPVFSLFFPVYPTVNKNTNCESPSPRIPMSGLKNSPFGKRLRASHQDTTDDEAPKRNRPRINPIFGVNSTTTTSTPSLDSSRPTTSDSTTGPESPVEQPRLSRDYGDRFVPSRDAGDMRTSYHLMDEGGPSTPSKNRIIPTESDALKGMCYHLSNAGFC
jgi:hypothetical protein